MLDSTTKKRIDDARDILVGKIPDPKSQVEQITIALIYKFMDDMDMESEELGGNAKFFVGEYAKYSWRKVYNKTRGGQEILVDYSAALSAMSNNANLPSIFHTIFKQAYLPYNDPETLKEFLKQINLFDYDHSEKLGDAFEYLLSVLGSQGDAGQFRTPRHIIDFMVDVVEPKKNETILDPACGTAGFLISAYKYILATNSGDDNQLTPDERKQLSENIVGYDISPDMVRLSLVNMYLHRLTNPKISEYDTLTSEAKWGEYFDVVLANPPFMSPKGGIKPHSRFSVQSKRSEALFVDYIAEHLTHTGRGAVIVPEGVIFKSDASFKKLRKMLVDENYLYGVISLPSGVFNPYSGVKTSILLFDKCVARQTNKLIFAKVENDGFALGAQRRPIEGSQLPAITSMIKTFRTAVIDGTEFENDSCTLVEKSKIAESGDYNLSPERYIKHSHFNSSATIVKLSEVCDFYRGVVYSKADEVESGKGILRANNINLNNELNLDDIKYISHNVKVNENQRLIADDIFICVASGSATHIGKVAYIKNDTNFYFGGFMGAIRVRSNTLAKYLYLQLTSSRFNEYLNKVIAGANIKNINKGILYDFEIPLPPIEEQKVIVAEIESYQKIIDAARTIVDNYRPQITIDPEWGVVNLGNICLNLDSRRKPITTSDRQSGEYPYYGASGIVDYVHDYIFDEDLLLISEDGANLLSRNTPIAFCVSGKVWINNHAHVLSFAECCTRKFVECFIEQIDISGFVTGAAQPKLTQKALSSIPIPLPPTETQQKIVAEIEREQKAVESSKELIEIFEQKIKNRIAKIWGE